MRTLKKTLCLVLALVMVLGLGAFGVSAIEYEDEADITEDYSDAIQLLAGLNVMQGNGGNFLPKETLDRAAAAVILTKLALGGAEVPNMPASFKDVDESYAWASNYIGYAQAQGYIKGYNDEYFGPADKLLGYQWGLMLLRVLGYDDTKEDMSSGYELGTAKLVSTTKLASGDDSFDVTKEITREEVAQLAFNALFVPEVHYVAALGANNGELTNTYTRTAGGTDDNYLATRFDLDAPAQTGTTQWAMDSFNAGDVKTGIITANSGTDAATYAKTTNVAVINFAASGKVENLTAAAPYKFVSDLDQLGHVVTFYLDKNDNVVSVNYETTEDDVITIAADITNNATKMAAAFGKGTDDAAKVVNFDAAYAPTVGADDITGFTKDDDAVAGTYVLYGGEIVSYLAPAAGNKLLSQVTAYTAPTESKAGSITLTGVKYHDAGAKDYIETGAAAAITLYKIGDEDNDDVIDLYDGIAKGDLVYITIVNQNVAKVEKAEYVEGATVSSVKGTTLTTDAGTFTTAAVSAMNVANGGVTAIGAFSINGVTATATFTPGKTYNLIVASDGTVLGSCTEAEEAPETTLHYGLVVAYVTSNGTPANELTGTAAVAGYQRIKVFTSEGKMEMLDLAFTANDDGTIKAPVTVGAGVTALAGKTADDDNKPVLVVYEKYEDGTVKTITEADATVDTALAKPAGTTYAKGTAFKVTGTTYATDKSVIFVYKEEGSGTDAKHTYKDTDFAVYVGYANVPGATYKSTNDKSAIDADAANGLAGAVAITGATLPTEAAATNDKFVFLTSATPSVTAGSKNNTFVYTYDAVINGEAGTVFYEGTKAPEYGADITSGTALDGTLLYTVTFDDETGAMTKLVVDTAAIHDITTVASGFYVSNEPATVYVGAKTVYFQLTTTGSAADNAGTVTGFEKADAIPAPDASTGYSQYYVVGGADAEHPATIVFFFSYAK